MATDPRTVTIAFAGDTSNIDQSFVNVLHATRQFGLEVETVTRKLGQVFEVETDEVDKNGDKIVKKVAAVRMEVKALAKDLDAAQKAQGNFQRLQLIPDSGYPTVGVKGTVEDTKATETRKAAEKLQATLLAYDQETAEKRRVAAHQAAVQTAELQKNASKVILLKQQEEELQLARKHQQNLDNIRAKLADPNNKYNKGLATAAINKEEKRYAQELAAIAARGNAQQVQLKNETELNKYRLKQIKEIAKAEEELDRKSRIRAENKAAQQRFDLENQKKWWEETLKAKDKAELQYIKKSQKAQEDLDNASRIRAEAKIQQQRVDLANRQRWWEQTLKGQAAEFSGELPRLSKNAKTGVEVFSGNAVVQERARNAQLEIEIEERKKQKLLQIEKDIAEGQLTLAEGRAKGSLVYKEYQNELLGLEKSKQIQAQRRQIAKQLEQEEIERNKRLVQDHRSAWEKIAADAQRQAAIFSSVSKRLSERAKVSGIGGTENVITDGTSSFYEQFKNKINFADGGIPAIGNELVKRQENLAQQEVAITERKNKKLLGLEIALKKDTIGLEKANSRRQVILENYQQELKDLQEQKNKLRAVEVKASKSVGGFGSGFKDLAGRIIEVNLLWNAVNKLNMAVSSAVTSIIPLGIQLDSVKASLQATVGGTSATVDVLGALNDEAQRTGLEIGNLRNNFKLFQASTSLAGASLQKTWRMFTDLNTVSAALHLTNEQTNSVFLAMAQIFNKGKVQAEELVRQLGNLLPGAFASFAAANQMTTQKLMEQMEAGRVFAQDTMEKFTSYMATKFSSSFATASQGLNADINRMNTEFTKLGEGLYALVRGPVQAFIQQVTNFTKLTEEATSKVNSLTVLLGTANVAVTTLATVALAKLIQGFKWTLTSAEALKVGMAFLSSPVVWVGTITAIITSLGELTDWFNRSKVAAAGFLEEQVKLQQLLDQQKAPPEIKLANLVENDTDVKAFSQKIKEAEEEIRKIKNGEFFATNFSTSTIETLNKAIENLRKLSSLTGKELPLLSDTDTPDKKIEKVLNFYELSLGYYRKKLELTKENVLNEGKLRQKTEEEAAIPQLQKSKDLDVINARIQAAELEKQQAVQARNWDAAGAANKKLLALEKEKLEATKKGSEVAEGILHIYQELDKLNNIKKDRVLNTSELKYQQELMTELGKLNLRKAGADAQATSEYLRNKERLEQKEKTDTAKQFPLFDAETKTALEDTKTSLKEQETLYKSLDQTAYQYYSNTAFLRQNALDLEIEAHEKRRALLTDSIEQQTESEKIKQLRQEKQTVLEETTQAYNKDYEQLVSTMNQINTKYLDSVGRYAESGLSKVQEETKNQIKTLETIVASAETPAEGNGFFDTQGEKAAKFNQLIDKAKVSLEQLKALTFDQQAEGFFKQYNEKAQFIDKELAIKEIMIRTRQKSGAITEFGALMERQTALSEFIKQKQTELGTLETQIKEASDKTDAASTANVAKWKQELAEKKALLAEFVASSNLLADRFETIFSDAFSNSFAAFVSGTQTASEAFQSFGQSVVQTLARMAAQELATQIFSWIKTGVSLFGGVAGAASGIGTSAATSLVDSAGGYPFASIPNYNGNVITDGTSSFYEQFKNKINFADGGIPAIGSVKQSFLMANGAVGTLRERGPEAILPLQRDSKGNLGVSTITDKSEKTGLNIEHIQINVENKKDESGPDLANTIAETLVRRLADEQIQKASRPGNLLNKTTRFG